MSGIGGTLAMALNALVPVFGADKITKFFSKGLKQGGKVKAPKAKKAKKATKPKGKRK
jgi:hypothetical protein